jgi:anti-sigma factor (TIGR02949 family)
MDCKQTNELLNAYVDKELSKSDQTFLEAHVAECPHCRAELDEVRRLDAQVRSDVQAPAELRSLVATRLEATRAASPRVSLKEMLGMRFKIGLAAMIAAALIVVGVMSTGGNAQAAYGRMKKAVTSVTSMHLHVEFNGPVDMDGTDTDKKDSGDSNDPMGNMANQAIKGLMSGNGPKSVDVWSEDNMFRVSAFGGVDVASKDGYVTVMFGDKVFAKVKADGKGIPKNLGETLFKEFTKATDEIKQKFNVVNRGTVVENGRTLVTLEVTGKDDDNGKTFKLMYWVDQDTNLPARFQVFADTEKGPLQLVCTITCEYNETYPDSMFEPGGKETP